ncbi:MULTISPECIES: hypothetical protein [unclassified Frankia]|uniref:hypothetical protein n=1 Tax=unclassified Frankia TaxID=2632575 RepID=UPI00202409F0
MSHRPRVRTATALLVAATSLTGTAALSACAAGSDALTSQARTTTNTVSGAVGTISLRNVYVAGPAARGADAQVVSAFFNGGTQEDQIIQVSSDAANGGVAPASAVLKPGGGVIYIANGSAPTLTGLNRELLVGQAVPVTFTFAKAGSVTLNVPVEPAAPGASAQPTAAVTTPPAQGGTTPAPRAVASADRAH